MEKMHHNIEYPPRTFWNNDFYGGIESTSKCQGSSFFFFFGCRSRYSHSHISYFKSLWQPWDRLARTVNTIASLKLPVSIFK